ncbi:DUF480 domain-containing protein [Chimaeribacter arupi]|uniref:DUF480 domain-containing protein n=2 Tax=Yersiniaceae TaxID=1903411 RepID=A0A2N5ERC9_9GAMM|nr:MULTISPECIES: DUF480 domain-containing protein [Yersiniaceae]MBS0967301.1 DUF480 domain-containing protein [Nissabacter archeti]MDV5139251.1 DUF480 domain-containing protein [Chimaeribacter arupi]PLR36554.1 DUF480 domain-containing protein [Chimaeribacter arupi]PLR48720.1 DUF480 domain-containing protein [Chimaeribacter arupi]PLR51639.1 DUF480 domain-containing protein [Chimaeribacter arupi]
MKHPLSVEEARVIGCLMEKQITTPELYPLSLNSLAAACNQKTNRDPVLELSESEVQQTLDLLVKKHLIRSVSGSRTLKYEHRFCNSEFGNLKFSAPEVALVTTLLLRGPQTAGELRTRAARLYEFSDVSEAEQALTGLETREDGPFVVRLAREPGKREHRYMHLFSGAVTAPAEPGAPAAGAATNTETSPLEARVAGLESQVAELHERLEILLARLGN